MEIFFVGEIAICQPYFSSYEGADGNLLLNPSTQRDGPETIDLLKTLATNGRTEKMGVFRKTRLIEGNNAQQTG